MEMPTQRVDLFEEHWLEVAETILHIFPSAGMKGIQDRTEITPHLTAVNNPLHYCGKTL